MCQLVHLKFNYQVPPSGISNERVRFCGMLEKTSKFLIFINNPANIGNNSVLGSSSLQTYISKPRRKPRRTFCQATLPSFQTSLRTARIKASQTALTGLHPYTDSPPYLPATHRPTSLPLLGVYLPKVFKNCLNQSRSIFGARLFHFHDFPMFLAFGWNVF